eukprot:3941981-Rhodomonas_salina.8
MPGIDLGYCAMTSTDLGCSYAMSGTDLIEPDMGHCAMSEDEKPTEDVIMIIDPVRPLPYLPTPFPVLTYCTEVSAYAAVCCYVA